MGDSFHIEVLAIDLDAILAILTGLAGERHVEDEVLIDARRAASVLMIYQTQLYEHKGTPCPEPNNGGINVSGVASVMNK